MTKFVAAYAAAGLVMLAVDAVWLSMMAPVYRRHLGEILLDGFRVGPAAAFYLLYVAGIVALAVMPAMRAGSGIGEAALAGAMLGLIAYGTYDLTNQATLKVWATEITLMDMAWGAFITALAAAAGAWAWLRVA